MLTLLGYDIRMSSYSKKNKDLVREQIEAAMHQAELEHRRRLLQRRLELARTGIVAYQNKQITLAVQSFHAYIRVLEEVKNVSEGGLLPSCFDLKEDLPELLMISGVYWDLAKLYDRTRSPDKYRDFAHYLNKYIIFSKNMPFQALCAETMRKYIYNEKPMHKKEFRNAYRALSDSNCFIATSLVDVISPQTLPSLQGFRDQFLLSRPLGRSFVRWYYRNGARLAIWVDHFPGFLRVSLAKSLDQFGSFYRRINRQ
jgi:hypothetical protein